MTSATARTTAQMMDVGTQRRLERERERERGGGIQAIAETGSETAEVTRCGRAFSIRRLTTGKARSPTVERCVMLRPTIDIVYQRSGRIRGPLLCCFLGYWYDAGNLQPILAYPWSHLTKHKHGDLSITYFRFTTVKIAIKQNSISTAILLLWISRLSHRSCADGTATTGRANKKYPLQSLADNSAMV